MFNFKKTIFITLILSIILCLSMGMSFASDTNTTNDDNSTTVNETVLEEGYTFNDIQNLIDESEENSTINLTNHTYKDNGSSININKSITLDGKGAILDGNANYLESIITINANNVILKNIIIPMNHDVFLPEVPTLSNNPCRAIIWEGNNGCLINSTINIPGLEHNIIWKGKNGSIIKTKIKHDSYLGLDGGSYHYKCIDGYVNGFYEGSFIGSGDCFCHNVSVNSKPILTVNNSVIYNGYLIIRLIDDNNLPYCNETIVLHIDKYGDLEANMSEEGIAKIRLPSNLTTGKHNITYTLKLINNLEISVGAYMKHYETYNYDYINLKNSSLTVKSPVVSGKNCNLVYGSGKYFNVSLGKGNVFKVKFMVYSGKKLVKTYTATSNGAGVASLKYNLKAGSYTVKSQIADKYCKSSVVASTLKIKKNTPEVTTSTSKIGNKKYLKIKVANKYTKKAISGLKLKVKVKTGKKYKTYTVITNKNGNALFNTKKLTKGVHKVLISSANSNYSISKSTSIRKKVVS